MIGTGKNNVRRIKMEFPKKGVSKNEVLDGLITAERETHMGETEKSFFATGPHLVSTPSLPWASEVRHFIMEEAYKRFVHGKTLLGDAAGLESEVVSMMGDLLGNRNAVGNVTVGGSESNFCGLLCAKGKARSAGRKGNISMVLPMTAHYSFFKACHMFDIEPIVVKTIPGTFHQVDPDDMRKAVREDTVVIAATAGTFPYGTVDPIEEIGEIAEEKGLYFHVDSCFGGFTLPFIEKGNYGIDVPKWDYRVKSVCSITADFHKNGLLPPPASCITFRNEELFSFVKAIARPRGNVTGTSAVAPMAAAWAMLKLVGLEGYIAITKNYMDLRGALERGIRDIPGLKVVPGSKVNLMVTYSDEYDLMPVIEALRRNGWVLKTWNNPPPICLVMVVRPQNDGQVESFLSDLRESMRLAEPIRSKGEMKVYGPEYPNIY